MELSFTVTGDDYEQILEKATSRAASFYEKYEYPWSISIGEIVPLTEKRQGNEVISMVWEAEVTATPWDGRLQEPERRIDYQYYHHTRRQT